MRKLSFRGGIHPLHEVQEGKNATRALPIKPLVPQTVCIPVNMHIGAHSKPIVKKGDKVLLGQVIAEPQGGLGLPVHASVSGEVTVVADKQMLGPKSAMCITIQSDGQDEWTALNPLGDVETAAADRIVAAIKDAGICGLGGACFPTHVKLTPPQDKPIDTIILNGAECETFLTSDHRLMVEQPERVVKGLRAVMRAMNVSRGFIGIEDNKPDAIAAVKQASEGKQGVEVAVLKTKYPQGGEKQLIKAITGKEVPSGGLPMDIGVVVLNVGTAAAITDAVEEGKPLISRVTTVTGIVKEPSNLLVRIGTLVSDAIEACGGYAETPGKIFAGGSMTGLALPNDTLSMTKANNGIVVLNEKQAKLQEPSNCIRCGRCIEACPSGLNPYQLANQYELGRIDEMEKMNVNDCIVCGACSYICPAHRYLTPVFKEAKDILAARRNSQ